MNFVPNQKEYTYYPIFRVEEIVPYIHWTFFQCMAIERTFFLKLRNYMVVMPAGLPGWQISLKPTEPAAEAMQLYKDAVRMLDKFVEMKAEFVKAVYGFSRQTAKETSVLIDGVKVSMLRQQVKREDEIYKSLADYIMPAEGKEQIISEHLWLPPVPVPIICKISMKEIGT